MKNDKNTSAAKKILAFIHILCLAAAAGTGAAAAAETESVTAVPVDSRQAETLALTDAGIAEEDAQKLRTETDREHGETVYEVSFLAEDIEYEYHIRESDGKIIEWEIEGRDLNSAAAELSLKNDDAKQDSDPQDAASLIGFENAKKAALADAGLDEEEITFSTIKFEDNEYTARYEIEFYQNRQEYEYEINACTGDVLKAERD